MFYGRHHNLVDRYGMSVTNDHGYVPLVINTSLSFPHSWLVTEFVTRFSRRVPLVEQELLTLQDYPSSPSVFSGVHVTWSLVLCVCLVDRCSSFCTFPLAIMLSILFRYTDSYYPFGIFKLFFLLLRIVVRGVATPKWSVLKSV